MRGRNAKCEGARRVVTLAVALLVVGAICDCRRSENDTRGKLGRMTAGSQAADVVTATHSSGEGSNIVDEQDIVTTAVHSDDQRAIGGNAAHPGSNVADGGTVRVSSDAGTRSHTPDAGKVSDAGYSAVADSAVTPSDAGVSPPVSM